MHSLATVTAIVGVVLVLYVAAVIVLAHFFTTPRRVVPVPPPASAGLGRVQFRARHDGLNVVAWYARAAAPTGAVILVHGRNACRGGELHGDNFGMAQALVHAGLSVLMIDLRGHGESDHARLTFGRLEARDILGAVDFLLARGYQPNRIGVLGASMGGVSAIEAAAAEPAIGAVVTDSAFADFSDLVRSQWTRLTRLPAFFMSGAMVAANALTGERLSQHSVTGTMKRLTGRPTLVIHAERDPFVPVTHARTLAQAGSASLWITAGTRHLASYASASSEYRVVVGEFFRRNLAG